MRVDRAAGGRAGRQIDVHAGVGVGEAGRVKAVAAIERVVPALAGKHIVARPTGQHIVARVATQRIGVGRARHVFDAAEGVMSGTAVGRIRREVNLHARRGVVVVRRIAAGSADQLVVARPAEQVVVARPAIEQVVALTAQKVVVAVERIQRVIAGHGVGVVAELVAQELVGSVRRVGERFSGVGIQPGGRQKNARLEILRGKPRTSLAFVCVTIVRVWGQAVVTGRKLVHDHPRKRGATALQAPPPSGVCDTQWPEASGVGLCGLHSAHVWEKLAVGADCGPRTVPCHAAQEPVNPRTGHRPFHDLDHVRGEAAIAWPLASDWARSPRLQVTPPSQRLCRRTSPQAYRTRMWASPDARFE